VKLHRGEPRISYLYYPGFEDDPHPALFSSLTVHLQTFRVKLDDFQSRINPPILHRKELFLAPGHPLRAKFARLTEFEEKKGLYEDSATIGTRDGWNEKLAAKKLYLKGHRLLTRCIDFS
jgi:DNA phosphorothioation-associated putative methyltransferase